MNPENQGNGPDPSSNIFVKRKRGRPRKDQSQISGRAANVLAVRDQAPGCAEHAHVPPGFERTNGNLDHNDDALVGQLVTGVIEATFDAGYLLSVRVGNSETTLRGVVFKPGHYMPISTDNDLAPHIQMITRNAVPSPTAYHTPVHGSYRRGRGRGRARNESRMAYSANGSIGNQLAVYNEPSPLVGNTVTQADETQPTRITVPKGGQISQTETNQMEKGRETDHGSLTKHMRGDEVMEEVVHEVVTGNQGTVPLRETQNESAKSPEPMQGLSGPLSVKPLQAMWSDNRTPSIPHNFRDARAGKMTELLLAVQENLIDKQAANPQQPGFNQHHN